MDNKYTDKKNVNRKVRKKRKKSSYNWNNILLLISVVIIFLYFLNNFLQAAKNKTILTDIVDFGNVESIVEKEMVIIRDSKVLTAPRDGKYELIYPEGERVKRGLAVIKTKTNSNVNYNYLIDIIESRIANLEKNGEIKLNEKELTKINNKIEQLTRNIQNRIQNDEIEYIEKIKKEIISLNDEKKYFFNNSVSISKEELLEQKNRLISEKNAKNSIVYSPSVGIISTYVDGLEDKFSIKNIQNLTISDINKVKNTNSINYAEDIKKGEALGTVSENFSWYLTCEVVPSDIEHIVSEKPIYIEIGDKRFVAYLENFHKGKDGKFLGYFRVEDEKFNFYEKRKINAKIILSSSDGLAIPKKAYIDYNGKFGVFVVERTGVAYFKEIKDYDAINNDFIGIKYDSQKTKSKEEVTLYDEVIINPAGIQEGQRVR